MNQETPSVAIFEAAIAVAALLWSRNIKTPEAPDIHLAMLTSQRGGAIRSTRFDTLVNSFVEGVSRA